MDESKKKYVAVHEEQFDLPVARSEEERRIVEVVSAEEEADDD